MSSHFTFEEYLDQYGVLTYKNKGVSMLPMLKQNRDLFTVVKKGKNRCEKYDVVLYRRPPNQYVLHRVVEVREKDYVILGDNCEKKEYGIKDEDILGILISFRHNGKDYEVQNKGYQLYVRVWYLIYPLRLFWKKIRRMMKHVIRRK